MRLPRFQEALLKLALQPRNLAKSLSRLMPAAASSGLIEISLDGQWFKLLQVEGPPHARRMVKVVAQSVEGVGPEEVSKLFSEACSAGATGPSEVLVANPTHLCTVRIFSLPSTDLKEIRDIVELQAEKHTPYAKEEIVTDFKIIDRTRSGYSRVLLVIAHQDVIRRSVQVVESSGVVLDRVGCELEGLINWFQLARKRLHAPAPTGASLVVDVDAGTTTVLVMQRGQPQLHRSLPMGTERFEGASTRERLVQELRRSIEAMDAEGATGKIQEVLLTGRIDRLDELKVLLERALEVPVQLLAPWEGCEVSEGLRAAYERLPGVSFAGLVGLACAPSHIDLTPQSTKLHQVFEARARALVLLGCQGLACLILITLLIIGRAQREQRYYTTLRAVYEQSAAEVADVEQALRETEFVKARLRARGQLLEAVDTLAKRSLPGIVWESMTFTQDQGITLKGSSTALPNIYEFVASLGDSPLFTDVGAKRVSRRKSEEGGELTEFEILCPLTTATRQKS